MPRLERVELDHIERPSRDERLHPDENEDQESWEEFRLSIGAEPIQQPHLVKNGDEDYSIIDGDRRIRALRQNYEDGLEDAGDVLCVVFTEDEIENGAEVGDGDLLEKSKKMLLSNEHREPNDKEKRAWHIAQRVAPHLLPPAERWFDEPIYDQSACAEEFGKSQPTISNWLEPVKNKRPLHYTLGKKKPHQLDVDDVETIDNIVSHLTGGKGQEVVPTHRRSWVIDKLEAMDGVSLGEIEVMAEKAVEEEWDTDTFLEETKSTYGVESAPTPSSMSSGPLGGEDPFASDDSHSQTRDDGIDAGPEGSETGRSETKTSYELTEREVSVDLDEVLPDDETYPKDDVTARDVRVRKWQDVSIQDDAAVLLNALAEVTHRPGESDQEAMERVRKDFLEPLIQEEAPRELGKILGGIETEAEALAD